MAYIPAPQIDWGYDEPQSQGAVTINQNLPGVIVLTQTILVAPSSSQISLDPGVGYATSG